MIKNLCLLIAVVFQTCQEPRSDSERRLLAVRSMVEALKVNDIETLSEFIDTSASISLYGKENFSNHLRLSREFLNRCILKEPLSNEIVIRIHPSKAVEYQLPLCRTSRNDKKSVILVFLFPESGSFRRAILFDIRTNISSLDSSNLSSPIIPN